MDTRVVKDVVCAITFRANEFIGFTNGRYSGFRIRNLTYDYVNIAQDYYIFYYYCTTYIYMY